MKYYLLQGGQGDYALVSEDNKADGWRSDIASINTKLLHTYNLYHTSTLLEEFAYNKHTVLTTFSDLSNFHNLKHTHPEHFI